MTSTLTGVLAIALLAGCGGSDGKDAAAPPASPSAAVSAAPSEAVTSPVQETPVQETPAAGATTPGAAAPETPAAGYNAADVSFARMVIPHHLQAIDMATLAQTHAMDPWIRDLASRVIDAQDPEIRTLKGWLDKWGEEPLPRDHRMPGMQSPAEIAALAKASGSAFDKMFVTMMIEHHGGAIRLADAEQARGVYADAKQMAASISATQAAEVKEMRSYLAKLK
ncbi:DUF305 domain-containing protein [Microbispora sp. ATCC PTA-5024]|uniref:DUF305 domain-containing protein n=1 Tax=Microbispora sp. ATCC PTA-5024 TaxID=316330 RepID=UPI000419E5FC|nr:DUF305 domain-containing protein [Microbispora sp. ATCC PTA-5024]